MTYVKIKFGQGLLATQANSSKMYSLGNFLTDDIGSGKEGIEWVLNKQYNIISSNRTFMEKDTDNDRIFIGDLFTEDLSEAAISAPTAAIIDLLQQWDEVCKNKPKEVTIYFENEKFRIEVKTPLQDKNE